MYSHEKRMYDPCPTSNKVKTKKKKETSLNEARNDPIKYIRL